MSVSYLTMTQFGKWGRAGNQFFQYAFLKEYARKYGCKLQLPSWVGNHLFGTSDDSITIKLAPYNERGRGLTHPQPPEGKELIGHDYRGYAQYHTRHLSGGKDRIRKLFQPTPEISTRFNEALQSFTGYTVIGLHIRRGDYGQNIFPLVPNNWYIRWLKENYDRFENPRVFIATEDPKMVDDFAEYNPLTIETLGISLSDQPLPGCTYLKHDLQTKDTRAMDWYPDFFLLSKCDVILGGSSTFSFFAAMLNPTLCEYWRASLDAEGFVRTDPWNAYPILREHVKDYPHLDGIKLTSNPYW